MAGQEEEWSGERVDRWLRQASGLERQLAPVSDVLFAAATIGSGEVVLDVGCGTGPTTRQAAALTGPSGQVTGLDVSAQMLAAAASVDPSPGSAPLDWIEADAVHWAPPPHRYDVVISRFGVMFFSDPTRAFANLAAACRPGGRMAVAVWARRTESPLFEVPYRVALDILGSTAEVPDDQGPFAWHDGRWVTDLLTAAGWVDVAIEPHRLQLPFGGSVDPERAAVAALDFGATRQVMVDADDTASDAVRAAIAVALADHVDADGHVQLEASIRVVTARR